MKLNLLFVLLVAVPLSAQTKQDPLIEALRRLKISGYLQAQYVEREDASAFSVRRGRIKFTYQATPASRFVLQPDIASSGVTLKDAYAELIEPWTSWKHTLTAGQFKWPFGFEVLQSSSDREMPERTMVVRRLFPGERDRGVMLSGAGLGKRFNYRAAVVNGNGTTESSDNDDEKDFLGRVGWVAGPVSGGVSLYRGSERGFDKEREGIDLQWATPVPGLRVRGEYIRGEQPVLGDVDGWYVYVIQNLGTRHQFVARVDEYEDDREDTATIGGAYNFMWDDNSKLTFAYERPDEENVVTLRYQFSF